MWRVFFKGVKLYISTIWNLEECSKMVEFYWRNGSVDIITVRNAYKNVLEKIYGSNYLKVLSKNIDYIGYKDL